MHSIQTFNKKTVCVNSFICVCLFSIYLVRFEKNVSLKIKRNKDLIQGRTQKNEGVYYLSKGMSLYGVFDVMKI